MRPEERLPLVLSASRYELAGDQALIQVVLDRPIVISPRGVIGFQVSQPVLVSIASDSGQLAGDRYPRACPPIIPRAWARVDADFGDLHTLLLKVDRPSPSRATTVWMRLAPDTLRDMASGDYRRA